MCYNRVMIAKVALGVASEDEIFWVTKCRKQLAECNQDVEDLEKLASVPATSFCLDSETLIRAGDTHKVSDLEHDHFMACNRCARIGQFIANMPFPKQEREHKSMGMSA
jgi:hypothetical protein